MILSLAFYFVMVFGDGEEAWNVDGPFENYEACSRAAAANSVPRGFMRRTPSACFGKLSDGKR